MIKRLNQILILGFVFFVLQTRASESYRPTLANPVLEPWRWTEFPEYDTIRITCLAKGADNGMWMGIGHKAVYYNGYKTVQFIPDSSNVLSLAFEKDNNLLATTSKGLFRFKEGEFRKILDFNFNSQRNFISDLNGDQWIGSDFGLIHITPKNIFCLNPEGYFEISVNGDVINTLKFEAGNDYHLSSVREIQFPVFNLTVNQQQRVWMTIGGQEKNLGTINLNDLSSSVKWKFLKIPGISRGSISGLCENGNSLYVATADVNIMLARYVLKTEKWENINMKLIGGDNLQSSILRSSDGTIWIGGHSKLYALRDSEWKVYQYPEVSLPLSYIGLFLDPDENLFIFGNSGNLMKLDLSYSQYRTYHGLNFQCNTADGKYWFTTNSGEVVSGDATLSAFEKFSSGDGLMKMAMSIFHSEKGGLWAAGSHHGKAAVALFQNGQWKMQVLPDLFMGISYNGVTQIGDSALAFPVNGVLNLGEKGGFVTYNFKKNTWAEFTRHKVPHRIPVISQTSDGKLWFAGGNSLHMYENDTTRRIDLPSNSGNWVDDVQVSPNDRIWVAQGGTGLFYFDGKKWTRYTTFNGLASNMVTNILIESDSAVYVASDKGISFFDGNQFIRQIIHPELNILRERGHLKRSKNGALWINRATREWYLYDFKSTSEDPSVFKTTMYLRENHPPKTNISFSNREISSAGNVMITYIGVDYWNQTSTDKIQFSHRLNDEKWSSFSEDKSSVFFDLDPGHYTLEVRARDLDRNIEAVPAQITFSILPPVYLRAWFILTILTFLGIIVWLLLRLYARNRQIHELDQLKLRLFTDISHELKTPLTLISLPLQKLLNKTEKQDETKDNLELIYTNVQRLNNLVNQVVDFRRLEAGKIQLEVGPGDLMLHLRNISNYYLPLAHEKNIRFLCRFNRDELWVKYDADKLEKIVVNLLSNAFKFTPENETVELIAQIDNPAQLQLWVNDSGPGIPKEMQQNVFDRFYRLRNEKLNRIPGSGIGLSLVKELINLYQGSIEVISDGVHGSSFYVTLPLQPAEKIESQPVRQEEHSDWSSYQTGEKATVLLIEDEEAMLRFITSELSQYFVVKGFGSVERAYEWLSGTMPDLIISDVMLPGMTGMEFCKKLKSDELTSHLPVILLTARDSEEDIVEGLGTGADDYITKPFKMNELIARCFNLIENRRRLKDRFAEQDEPEIKLAAQTPADQQLLDKAFRIVYQNLDNPDFDVPQFCSAMNMSKTLLYSKLKSLTGQSATEFVRNIRLKEARKLLQQNAHQHTIAEISYRVGFNDPLYFSRCFRKYFGVPPSEIEG